MQHTNRILVVDDDPSIHEAFTKILANPQGLQSSLDTARAAFAGKSSCEPARLDEGREVFHAHQGEEGVQVVAQALTDGAAIDVAFVDVRMPPGIDGIETVRRIWQVAPKTEIVLCTAWSDYSHEETLKALGYSHRLLILKKPFESIEVRQMALALHEKGRAARQEETLMNELRAASSETKAYAASLVTANRALSLSNKANSHMAYLKAESLEDLTREIRDLTENVMGGFLASGDPKDMEKTVAQARELLARLEAPDGLRQP